MLSKQMLLCYNSNNTFIVFLNELEKLLKGKIKKSKINTLWLWWQNDGGWEGNNSDSGKVSCWLIVKSVHLLKIKLLVFHL